ncbi:SUMF1/EgtB/PvdO family nonheme iron enzyme [Novipirellula sp. SH528]|uniref:nSTAND1 domain-containing NTPase n=1 Tax=Novipirellula sp. SH528 TaxID=3454466 RepID=UPI003FA0E5AF
MTVNPRTIRIFISSPGDVAEERDGARRVVEGLQRMYPGTRLLPVLWEELALPATASFQETIDFLLGKEPIDIAVFILWSRLGSPLGAAIARPDGTPYRSGTERELDLMLAAFEQSGRERPVILAYARDDDAAFKQRLTELPTSQLEEFVNQRKLAEAFIREQFHDAEGRNLRAYQTYREPVGFVQRLRLHMRHAIDVLMGADAAPSWTEEPYRGLEVFDIGHAAIFHGREEETCQLLQRLRDQEQAGCAFAVIVGASGSGKSSLARAGVAANLVQYAGDDDSTQWHTVTFIPALSAADLCAVLVRLIAESLPGWNEAASTLDDIAESLAENAPLTVRLSIAPAFSRASDQAGRKVRLLLLLDQLEELWTDRHTTSQDRERFFAAIEALARSGHVVVLATLRSDFYHHAQQMPIFLQLKGRQGHYDLLPPNATSIQRLITEPARLAGLRFERNEKTGRSLDEVIFQDAARDPHALPLLEYTLAELYRQRDDKRRLLTFAAYVELGGVEGAIGKRADETFASLPPEAQAAMDEILPLLVSVDVAGDQAAVRRRASEAELTSTPARKTLVGHLVAARFLTTDRQDDTPIASLAHEALLRRWDRIVNWISANREQLRLRSRVEQTQQRWEQQDRNDSLLLAEGLPLDEGRQLLSHAPYLLTSATSEYIDASIAYHERKAKRSRRQRAIVLSTIAALLVVMIVGGLIMRSNNQKNQRVSEAKGLVQRLMQSNTSELPAILSELSDYHELTRDELSNAYSSSEDKSNAKLHAALALLPEDASLLPFIIERMLRAEPAQVETICSRLAEHRDTVVAELWPVLERPDSDQQAQLLHAATALAMYDASNTGKWKAVAERVAKRIVSENPLRLAVWIKTLRPVRQYLVPPLGEVFRTDPSVRPQSEIDLATYVLEDYAADDSEQLSELLLDAEPKQFTALFDELKSHGDAARDRMLATLAEKPARAELWDDASVISLNDKPVTKDVREQVESGQGMLTDRFALVQTLPLDQFASLAETLGQSGYRLVRLRPYNSIAVKPNPTTASDVSPLLAAAIWHRDGRAWSIAIDQTAEEMKARDEELRGERFGAVDVAGYIGLRNSMPAELFAAVWVERNDDSEDSRSYLDVTASDHERVYWKLETAGYKFHHALQIFRGIDGQSRYSGVQLKQDVEWNVVWDRSPDNYSEILYLDRPQWDISLTLGKSFDASRPSVGQQIAETTATLEKQPEDRRTRLRRAIAFYQRSQFTEAINDLDLLIEKSPSFPFGYRYRAICYAGLANINAAENDLKTLRELVKDPAAYATAIVQAYAGDFTEAEKTLTDFATTVAEKGVGLYQLARAYAVLASISKLSDQVQSSKYESKALEYLEATIGSGQTNIERILIAPDFNSLRESPSFKSLLGLNHLDRRYAAIWNAVPGLESQQLHGMSPTEHRHAMRQLELDGFSPVSLTALVTETAQESVAASVWQRKTIPATVSEELASQQANAAAALARLGEREKFFAALRITDDPESLTQFVHHCRVEGVTTTELLECLNVADQSRRSFSGESRRIEDRVLFGLLLALGEFALDELPPTQRDAAVNQVAKWFSDDPSSAIHGVTGWLLRQWGQTDLVQRVDQTALAYDPNREWFTLVIEAGEQRFYQTYVVIPPGDYDIGSLAVEPGWNSDETQNRVRVRLTRPVAILDREVTHGEFKASGVFETNVTQYSPTTDHPMVGASWYDSIQYCRWLTEQVGLPEVDQAYADPKSLDQAKYALDGDTEYPKNWPVHLHSRGFRLPTEAEWEIAARGGMRSKFGFGNDAKLLDRYAWFQDNSGRQTHVAKELRPNLRGLFDMHAGAFEWCYDWVTGYDSGMVHADPTGATSGSNRVIRGGSWSDVGGYCGAASRGSYLPTIRVNACGFRVALVPFVESSEERILEGSEAKTHIE